MTAQEILDDHGFLIVSDFEDLSTPLVVECTDSSSFLPLGAKIVLIEKVSEAEAQAWSRKYKIPILHGYKFHYKAVAE